MKRGWCWGGVGGVNGSAKRNTSGRLDGLPCDIAHRPVAGSVLRLVAGLVADLLARMVAGWVVSGGMLAFC